MGKEWFILQFKPNSQLKAIKNLNQQGFETFLPLCSYTSRNVSVFRNITRPLFPGYMFVAFDQAKDEWRKINNTFGVSRLISYNPIPYNLVKELKQRYDSTDGLIAPRKFRIGEKVKILDGPFTNFIATIETLESNQRISILIDLMGRKTKTETTQSNLKLSN